MCKKSDADQSFDHKDCKLDTCKSCVDKLHTKKKEFSENDEAAKFDRYIQLVTMVSAVSKKKKKEKQSPMGIEAEEGDYNQEDFEQFMGDF